MQKTLSVSAIQHGSVVDHVPVGKATHIISLLNLISLQKKVTVGLNLQSKSMKQKDLLKIEGHEITTEEGRRIAILAPHATVVIIKDYSIIRKFAVELPEYIKNMFVCPYANCITNHERVETYFKVYPHGKFIKLQCNYCERIYTHEDIKEHLPL